MADAINRADTKIYITDTGNDPSTLSDSDIVTGSITEINTSGGEREQETIHTFGGDIVIEQPRGEISLDMEVTPSQEDESTFINYFYGEDSTNTGVYTSATDPTDKAVYIEADDGTNVTTHAFNQLQATSFDVDQGADGERTISLTFNTSPETQDGSPNYVWTNDSASNLPTWDSY